MAVNTWNWLEMAAIGNRLCRFCPLVLNLTRFDDDHDYSIGMAYINHCFLFSKDITSRSLALIVLPLLVFFSNSHHLITALVFVTSTWQPSVFLTASWLPTVFLTALDWLVSPWLHCALLTAPWQALDCRVSSWQLLDCTVPLWQLLDFRVSSWQLLDCPVSSWQLLDCPVSSDCTYTVSPWLPPTAEARLNSGQL